MSIICCLERTITMAKLLKTQPGPALRPFYFCSWELQWQRHLQTHLLTPCTIFQTLRVSLRFSSLSLQCPWLPIPVRLSQQSYLLAGRSSGLCHLHSLRCVCLLNTFPLEWNCIFVNTFCISVISFRYSHVIVDCDAILLINRRSTVG